MVLSLKPALGQNIALHALPAARNSALLIFVFLVHGASNFTFSKSSSTIGTCVVSNSMVDWVLNNK